MENEDSLDIVPTTVKIINRFSSHTEVEIDNTFEEKTLREVMEENRRGFPTEKYFFLAE